MIKTHILWGWGVTVYVPHSTQELLHVFAKQSEIQ